MNNFADTVQREFSLTSTLGQGEGPNRRLLENIAVLYDVDHG